MKPHVRAFRNIASQACKGRMSFQVLLTDFGLEDVLAKAEEDGWSPKEIACQVVVRCCITEGKVQQLHGGLSRLDAISERAVRSPWAIRSASLR